MYDRNIQIRNLSQGYTMKETLEMLIDLFDICFDSDGANDWMIEQIEEKGEKFIKTLFENEEINL